MQSPNQTKKCRLGYNKTIVTNANHSVQQPLGNLINQINSLKKELKSIKSKKQLSKHSIQKKGLQHSASNNSMCGYRSDKKTYNSAFFDVNQNLLRNQQKHENDKYCQNNDAEVPKRVQIDCINYPSKDKKLKMDIQINKLRKIIQRGRADHIATQINILFSLINLYNEQLISEHSKLKDSYEQQRQDFDQLKIQNNHQVYKQKYKNLVKINTKLQEQVKGLRQKIEQILQNQNAKKADIAQLEQCSQIKLKKSRQIEQEYGKGRISTAKLEQELNIVYRENKELSLINAQLRSDIAQLTQKIETACEKVIIYEKNLQKKENQLVLMQQDVNYLRIQSQKFREQKKQMEFIYEQISQKYRELKLSFDSQVEKLNREKAKLQNQLKLRRHQSEQILQLESQKNHLYKQVQFLREQLNKKASQAADVKFVMQQQQKKCLMAESQLYRVKSDNQKLERSIQFSKGQIASLYEQVEQLQRQNDKHRDVFKNRLHRESGTSEKQQKLRTLDQIHSMIRKHKQSTQMQ